MLLTTGYSAAAHKAAEENFAILLKPYQIEALERAIRDTLNRASTIAPS